MKEKVWTAKEVEEVLLLAQDSISLNALVNDEDGKEKEIGAFIEDPAPGPEELLLIEDRKNTIKNLMEKHLKPREVRLIAYRFGLDDGTPKTLEEVGKIFGLTRERVRQLEEKALRKLKIAFLRNGIVEKGEF